ncbi:MAG: nicotinamide-nucleotide adenylyltransferase [Candidatus Thorarchaeota archaeon]
MVSLFVGRFQPVHKGHIHTIKQILDIDDELIIVVGSAQHSHTPDNPFTGGERIMFLKHALKEEGVPLDRVYIIPVPDININPLWIAHVTSLVPYFDIAYSHNPLVKKLFEDAGVKVDETELLKRNTYSAKHVRDLLRWDGEWEPLVPDIVAELMKKHKLDQRVKIIGELQLKR